MTGSFSGTATFGDVEHESAGAWDVFVAALDADGAWLWSVRGGGTAFDVGYGISALPDGSAIVVGRFAGTAAFGDTELQSAGLDDVFAARVDAGGSWVWATSAGGTDFDHAAAVATLPDGRAVVAGQFSGSASFGEAEVESDASDAFVAAIDADGAWTWVVAAGASDFGSGSGVALRADGSAIAVGRLVGAASFGATGGLGAATGAFVAEVDADGSWTWAAGVAGKSAALAVALLGDGGVVVTGYYYDIATFGPLELIHPGPDDTRDAFIAMLDDDGSWMWALQAGSTGDTSGLGVESPASDRLLVAGGFAGTASFDGAPHESLGGTDVFVTRLAADGSW